MGVKTKAILGRGKITPASRTKVPGRAMALPGCAGPPGSGNSMELNQKKKKNFSGYVELADGGTRPFFKGGSKILAYFVFMFIRRYIRLGDELDCKGVACRDLPRENGPFPLMDR